MARRRSRSRRANITAGGIGSIIGKAAPYVAFLQQLTEKDIAALPAGRTYVQQGKDLVNIVTGRMGGFHLFNAVSDYKPPFTINPLLLNITYATNESLSCCLCFFHCEKCSD